MEDARKEQLEALEVLTEFNERLVKNMNIIVKELSGERLDDTMEVLNDGKERVNKESFNAAVVALSQAIGENDDAKMAEEFKKIIPVFEQLGVSAKEVIK